MKRAPHIKMTEKQFKAEKRMQFKKVIKAINELTMGSAYLPQSAFMNFSVGKNLILKAQDECRYWWKDA